VHAEEGLAAVPAQFDALSDTLGRVCLLLPTQPAGPRRVKLYLTPLAPTVTSPVTAEQNGATITVNTGSVTLTFDPAKGGGLPSKIVFTQGGKSWDGMVFNDRVYQPALQGFRLGDDKEPQVRLTANGPLYTEVQVAARYLAGDRPTPANTAATYTFSFLAGSPTFRVSGAIQQGQAFDWQELHFLELYFKDKAFPEYAASDAARQSFKEVGKGDYHPRWGALIDGLKLMRYEVAAEQVPEQGREFVFVADSMTPLTLNYVGALGVKELWLDGVLASPSKYSALNVPAIFEGPGMIGFDRGTIITVR
jgi:hypothetical protein